MLKFDFRPNTHSPADHSALNTQHQRRYRIEPFDHEGLENATYSNPGRITVVVREKLQAMTLPASRITSHDDWINSIIKQTRGAGGEFVVLQIQGQQVDVEAGAWGSAPLYLLAQADGICGSWDLADLRPRIGNGDLDDEQVIHFLTGRSRYTPRSLFSRVSILTERARATWTPSGGLKLRLPPPAVHHLPRKLHDQAQVLDAFDSVLRGALNRRDLRPDMTAVELSGGTDSGVVALGWRGTNTFGELPSYGMIISGPAREQQRYRRKILTDLIDATDTTIDATDHLPLGPDSTDRWLNPVQEPYAAALAAALERVPASTVLTGIGGDELVALRPDEQRQTRAGNGWAPSWLGLEVKKVASHAGPRDSDAPVSVVPETALLACLVRAPVFLRAGRWPVAPLCDPELARFFEWLPALWRAGKRLPRDWMRLRHAVPIDVAAPRIPENFADVMQLGLRTYGMPHLHTMLDQGSMLFDRGYVDPDQLRLTLRHGASDGGPALDHRLHDVVALDRALTSQVQ